MTLREIANEISIFFVRSAELPWLQSSWLDAKIQYVAGAIFLYLILAVAAFKIFDAVISSLINLISDLISDWRKGDYGDRAVIIAFIMVIAVFAALGLIGLIVGIYTY